jgi:hypothetical protein
MLIRVFLECDLFKILVELSGLEDPSISLQAQKNLKVKGCRLIKGTFHLDVQFAA